MSPLTPKTFSKLVNEIGGSAAALLPLQNIILDYLGRFDVARCGKLVDSPMDPTDVEELAQKGYALIDELLRSKLNCGVWIMARPGGGLEHTRDSGLTSDIAVSCMVRNVERGGIRLDIPYPGGYCQEVQPESADLWISDTELARNVRPSAIETSLLLEMKPMTAVLLEPSGLPSQTGHPEKARWSAFFVDAWKTDDGIVARFYILLKTHYIFSLQHSFPPVPDFKLIDRIPVTGREIHMLGAPSSVVDLHPLGDLRVVDLIEVGFFGKPNLAVFPHKLFETPPD